jgi:response regulator of citrate/malate metabolism
MSTQKSDSYHKVQPGQHHAPFEYILIVENSEADLFIHQTLVKTISLGNRVEKRSDPGQVLLELANIERLADIPDLILLSIQPDDPDSFRFLERFGSLPDLVRAKCKLIIITAANSKEEKIKAIMNPSVIRYLEKPIDICNFRDFMYM